MVLLDFLNWDTSKITSDSLVLSLVGYVIVFMALTLLFYVFTLLPKILRFQQRRQLIRKGKKEQVIEDITITGEVSAAISTALHLYFSDLHDEETRVLTVNKISRRYSPWSSKIYNVTKGLNRRF